MKESASSLLTVVKLYLGYATFVALGFLVWLGYVLVAVLPGLAESPAGDGVQEAGLLVYVPWVFAFLVVVSIFVAHVVLLLLLSRWVRLRERYAAVIAGNVLLCVSFPVGTAIGVWALTVLPGLKSEFESGDS